MFLRAVGLVLPAFLVAGCSYFTWLPFINESESDKNPREPTKLVEFEQEASIKRLWHTKVGKGLGRKYLRISPAVVADRIYAADAYGAVEALDRFTGKRIWQTRIGEIDGKPFYEFWDRRDPSFVAGGVGAGGGRILIGTTRGEVIALDAGTGEELWRTFVYSEILSKPAANDDVVVAQTSDGRLVALESEDGTERWSFDSQVPVLTLRGTAAPVVASGLVYAGFATGMVSAVRVDNGEPIWQHRIMLPEGRSELERMADVDGTPLIGRGVLFAASYQGRVKALRRSDGVPLWELDASSYLDLAEGYGQLYLVDADDVITALEQSNADVVWEQSSLRYRRLTSPLAFSNYVVVGDADGYLHVMAQSDGRFIARRKIDGKGLRSAMITADSVIYLITNSGQLEALEIRHEG
ncbi:MAG: outer membrane protein assembly factor BamB [Gammaproteobacteria bacterium]|nr:outer membrane protein assembly factor BamB [Gammaproteobacteria bacterium]